MDLQNLTPEQTESVEQWNEEHLDRQKRMFGVPEVGQRLLRLCTDLTQLTADERDVIVNANPAWGAHELHEYVDRIAELLGKPQKTHKSYSTWLAEINRAEEDLYMNSADLKLRNDLEMCHYLSGEDKSGNVVPIKGAPGYLYSIRLVNTDNPEEQFFKVGITEEKDINARFRSLRAPWEFELLDMWELPSKKRAELIERQILDASVSHQIYGRLDDYKQRGLIHPELSPLWNRVKGVTEKRSAMVITPDIIGARLCAKLKSLPRVAGL